LQSHCLLPIGGVLFCAPAMAFHHCGQRHFD
jgi:hypothetical protein